MKEQEEGGLIRGFRAVLAAILALALSLPVGGLSFQSAYADEEAQQGDGSDAAGQTLGADADDIRIAVLSDTHYYPLNYVSDCEDYRTYVGGDPKMLEESGSILDAALVMVQEDQPDILLVSGDLTKDGEKLGHQQLADRFQQIEDSSDTEVFVINGNHDIYNYQDSCTFENGQKESAETTTPEEFKDIYTNFGYNGDFEAQYFTNPDAASGEQAGGLSYTVDLGKFTIVAVDSGMYSPDAGTGYDTNEHVTAGRVDEDLIPWVVDQTKNAEAEGDTVIGLMHHGLVPHFTGEENILSEYVVENWRDVATQFADAGMRYIFTGHMHANDMAQFTSNAGNTITDLETGSLSSWMSPVRTVTLTKGAALDDGTQRTRETFSVSSESVKAISFKDHTGAVTQIDDLKSYTQQKLYPETLFNNMANGMLRPMLQEIGEAGLRPWLAENLPDVDIDSMVLSAVRDALAGGMEIELGTGIGRVHVEYRNGGIQLSPSGTAGIIGNTTITDAQILRLVDDVLNTVETKYIDDPEWLLGKVDEIVTQVSNMGITSLDSEQHTIYDLVFVVLTGHYAGHENPPAWVEGALAYIESGNVVQTLIATLIDDVMPIIDTLLADNSIDTGIAFSGLWKTAIDSQTDNGNLKSTLELFGFDSAAIRSTIEGLINEYMSPSFLTGMGSLISEIARSMLYDSNFTDDVIDGEGVTVEFDGTTTAPEPSVDNGLLPTQVTMTLGANPVTDRNFRWYTGTNVTSGTVQVATDDQFQNIVAEVQASSEQVTKPKTQLNLGLVTTYGTQQAEKHSVSVSGLDDGATYYYRVGNKDNGWWSSAYQFATGDVADADDAFTFINVNDSQGMVESDYDVYKNTLAQADATFPKASFTVHGGDFVDDGANEDYWTWALNDEDGVAQGMSMTPAAGNHEAKSEVEGITDANPIVSHFNLANVPEGQDLSTGVYYSYVYKNATFVVLNTNDLSGNELSQAQYSWAYDTLANADTEWKIVLMHKSPYSNGPHQADDDVLAIRSQINSLAAATDVDVVLSGHDHVYNRTPYLAHGNEQNVTTETQNYEGVNYETALNPSGTVFVIAGTCGVKNYVQTPSDSIPSEVSLDLSVPVFTGITIDGDHLYYRAYKVEGGGSVLVDSFAISKAEEDAAPAWKQVEDMIAALPEQSEVTTDDKAAIEAARVAYDELSAEDQQKVSNYDRLVAAERMLSLLQTVAGKRTVTVSNHDDFTNAINDPSVGTIITQGTIEFDEGGLFDDGDREIYVTRDVVVGGTGELRFCRFHVQNGATLVLKDSVYVNDTRSQGSFYDALNPVEVYANSTLITQGSVSLRTEYGTGGSDDGVAVKLRDSGATAILGSSGTYWGSEAAVLSTASGTTLVINDGTYNAKNANRVVIDTHGDATVNGGTISSMWISGTLRVNGGTFEHQDSASSNWTPLAVSGGNAYITGGTFSAFNGRDGNASIKLENNAKLHVLADTNGAVNIGSATPYVGSPSTSDYKNVKLGYVKSNGWDSSDGIYRVDGTVSASSVEDIAGLSATRLGTQDVSDSGNYMTTVLPDGTSTVFGKYWIYGGNGGKSAPSGSGIIGSGDVIVYGPTRTIQNNPVEGVVIDGDVMRVADMRQDGANTLRLNGYTTPANAFDNGISWASDNEQTATVSANAGQGIVSVHQAGGANITATSESNPSLSAKVEVIAVDPTIEGPEVLDEDTTSATYEANKGFSNSAYDERVSFKYSVDDNTVATIDADTGMLTKLAAGAVKVTATLHVDGESTEVTVERDVVCKMRPEVTVDNVNALLNVQVSDANEAMASEHGAQTFDALIANSEGQNDAYAIGEVYSEDAPAEGLIESAAQFFGLAKAEKIWKVDVTIQAAPYVAAFDEALGLEAGTHSVSGDASKTVTLVWSDGDLSAEVPVPAGWTLEDPAATPVTFQGVCESPLQDVSVNPDAGNTAYVYDGTGKPFAFTTLPSDDIEGFTVEYRSADSSDDAAWSIDVPMNAGSYDVRVTRAADGDYNAFKQIFESGVVIAKAKATAPDIRYSEGETPGTIEVILQNGNSDTYYWSESDDRSDQQEAENKRFEVRAEGTYYVWGAGDENLEDSDLSTATIVKVTFDDNDGIDGTDEAEGAVFTKGNSQVILPANQCLNSWGGLPAVEWDGHQFLGWVTDDEADFEALTAVGESMVVSAQWSVDAGDVDPAAPTAEYVAEQLGDVVAVELAGVNEFNGSEGSNAHPDVTFGGTGGEPLIADSFTVEQPVKGSDGTWTVEVAMDAQKYLDAYADMGNPAHGKHYFAKSDEDGREAFTLTYDSEAKVWKLAEGQQASFSYEITCLTLRPASVEKYVGGTSSTGDHFADQYVIDGQGNAYTIAELNELLDEGTSAQVRYYNENGEAIEDDTQPGRYTARVDLTVEGAQTRTAGDESGAEESVDVTVNEHRYTFALEPSQLVIRSVSDAEAAESGKLNVPLVDASSSAAIKAALETEGGVAAALPDNTTIYFNGNVDVPLADASGVTLFSDQLLPGQREQELVDHANSKLGAGTVGSNYDFQYLDLVDQQQSNAWVSSSEGTTVFWRIPEGADAESIKVYHFSGLHRDYSASDQEVSDLIAESEVEPVTLDTGAVADGYVSFHVPSSGFSPYVMTWEGGSTPPTQQYTVTFDVNGGALDGGHPGTETVTAGGTLASLPTASRVGYDFAGWTTAEGAAFTTDTLVSANITVTAAWTPKTYAVTLNAQGGAFDDGAGTATVTATYDAALPALPAPTRDGYTFKGWFTSAQGGEQVTAGTTYQTAGACTYYAQWELAADDTVELTLDAGEGVFEGGSHTTTVEVPTGGTLSEGDVPILTLDGYELAGWFLDEDFAQPVVFAEDADPAAGIAATTFDSAVTLYAKWLADISSDADISFAGIAVDYTGAAVPAVPTYGQSFPASEQAKVQVLYRSGSSPWSSGAPVGVGSYDVKFVYEGSSDYAPFEKEYPAGIVISKATLSQTGLAADPAEVAAGTKLADVALVGATVTMADGTPVAGAWSWVDTAGVVNEAGTYRAVFTPTDTASYEPLYVDVQINVKASDPDTPGTDPDNPNDPGTNPGNPGDGTDGGNGGGSGSGDGNGNGSSNGDAGQGGNGSGDGNAGQGANQPTGNSGKGGGSNLKALADTGDAASGVLMGAGAVLLVALAACLTALVLMRRAKRGGNRR